MNRHTILWKYSYHKDSNIPNTTANKKLKVSFNPFQKAKKLLFFAVVKAFIKSFYKFAGDFGGELGIFGPFFGEGKDFVSFVGFVGKDLDKAGVFEFADKDGCSGFIAVDSFGKFSHSHCWVLRKLKQNVPMR